MGRHVSSYSEVAFVLDAADVQPDACNDTQEACDEQRIVGREGTDARQNQHYCTYYYKE